MKRISSFMLAAILMISTASAVDLYVDAEKIETDTPPAIVDGRALVPLRAIFEAIGAELEWDGDTRTATGKKGDTTIFLQIDNTTVYVNGEAKTLDVPAQLINGRTMVPVRFISESLNCSVIWDSGTSSVRVFSELYDVVRVIDGDTIVVNYHGTEETVRLIGVDAPESVHPTESKNTEAGFAASEFTTAYLTGKQVSLEFDVQKRDQYGRLLAYVYVDGIMLNEKLLQTGHASVATYPPNVKYADRFTEIVRSKDSSSISSTPSTPTTPVTPTNPTVPTTSETTNPPVTSRTIYITPTGKRYHYDNHCNGGTYIPSTLREAESRGLTPCNKCVK